MDRSLLATLSPELRNTIWNHVLASTSPLVVNNRSTAAPHALTTTCRQIRAETLLMFYSARTVQLHLTCSADPAFIPNDAAYDHILQKASRWLDSLTPACHALITHFELHIPVDRRIIPLGHRDTDSNYEVFTRVMVHKRLRGLHLPKLVKELAKHGYSGERQPVLVHLTKWAYEPFEWIGELRRREAEEMGFRPAFASDSVVLASESYGRLAEGSVRGLQQQWLP